MHKFGFVHGFESRFRQELSTTEVRPLSKALLPGRRCVGCLLLQVCVHLDGLNQMQRTHFTAGYTLYNCVYDK